MDESISQSAPIGEVTRSEIRRAAMLTGGMGTLFSVLFLVSLWLLRRLPRPPDSEQRYIDFYNGGDRRPIVLVGLYLLPLAAVAFVWFIAALRQWVAYSPRHRSQMLGMVQLVSGVGFIMLTLVAAAASILPAALVELTDDRLVPAMAQEFPLYGETLLLVFGIRMAAMFVMSTTSISRRAGVIPRWFSALGVMIAAVLFLSYSLSVWLVVAFPVWVLVYGLLIIRCSWRLDEMVTPRDDPGSTVLDEP